MIDKTNYQMVRTYEHNPKEWGILSADEIDKIEKHFKIRERSDIELQNLRDFIAMYYHIEMHEQLADDKHEYFRLSDTLSAITGVIDREKVNRGMEV